MNTIKGLLAVTLAGSHAIERDGGLRSALRRARTSLDIVGFEAVECFGASLKRITRLDDEVAEAAMALIAQRNVLAYRFASQHQAEGNGTLAKRLGEKFGERRLLSELRFQRLLRATSGDDRFQQMRRAIALLDKPIHPVSVVQAYLDLHSDRGRREFARAYFADVSSFVLAEESESPVASVA